MVGGVTIWAIIWTGRLPHLPGPQPQRKQALSNQQRQPQYEYLAVTTATMDCSSINSNFFQEVKWLYKALEWVTSWLPDGQLLDNIEDDEFSEKKPFI